jgi:putative thioredoxin
MTSSNRGAPPPRMVAAMAGAVDLAAVKARSEAAARAAGAPAPDASNSVVDVTEATFQSEVLDRSFQVPVIIYVRSERSEASTQLTPALRRLATEAAGQWVLAIVDIDANPRVAQALQVQAVPTVFAVIGGQLVPGFAGALPEAEVREFVAAVLEAGNAAGLSAAAPDAGTPESEGLTEPPADPRFVAAENALEAGEYAAAAEAYRAVLAEEPANEQAVLALRQTEFLIRVDAAPRDAVSRAAAAPDDAAAQLAAADAELAGGDADAALARLLGLVRTTSGEDRDLARDRLVEYFDLLGPDDPRVPAVRRDLANALF